VGFQLRRPHIGMHKPLDLGGRISALEDFIF